MKFVRGFTPGGEYRLFEAYINADKIISISPVKVAEDDTFWVNREFDGGSRIEVDGKNDVYSYSKVGEIVYELEEES